MLLPATPSIDAVAASTADVMAAFTHVAHWPWSSTRGLQHSKTVGVCVDNAGTVVCSWRRRVLPAGGPAGARALSQLKRTWTAACEAVTL